MIWLQSYLDGIAETINNVAIPPIVRMNGFAVTTMPTLGFSTVDIPQVDQIIESLVKLANVGAEVFPNREITETIFGMLRLPTAELGENLEDAENRREELEKQGGLFGKPGELAGGQEEEEQEEEEA